METASGPLALSGSALRMRLSWPGVRGSSCCACLCCLLEARSGTGIVVLPDAPKASPVMEALVHPLWHGCLAIWALPSKLTSFQASKETPEPFLMVLLQLMFVLEHGLIIGSLLRFLKLVIHRLDHQFSRMRVSVAMPVGPIQCWWTSPVLCMNPLIRPFQQVSGCCSASWKRAFGCSRLAFGMV